MAEQAFVEWESQPTPEMPAKEVRGMTDWGWFDYGFIFLIIALVVAVLFSYIYFNPRKKGRASRVDRKAGDEGED